MKSTNIKVNGLKGVEMGGKSITMWKNISPDRGYLIDIVLFSNLDLSLYQLKIIRNNTIWNVFDRKRGFFHGLKFIQDKIIPAKKKFFFCLWEMKLPIS